MPYLRLIITYAFAVTAIVFLPSAALAQSEEIAPVPTLSSILGDTASPSGITSVAPAGPTLPPSTNVYDASDDFSPVETRNLLALAAVLAMVGGLILEEKLLAAMLARLAVSRYSPARARHAAGLEGMRMPPARRGTWDIGGKAPAQ
jgi:hypothetical protein